jgi:hypothetical protein
VGPPRAGMWAHSGLLSGLLRWPWVVLYLFMRCGSCVGMTCRNSLGDFSLRFAPSCGLGGEAGCHLSGMQLRRSSSASPWRR